MRRLLLSVLALVLAPLSAPALAADPVPEPADGKAVWPGSLSAPLLGADPITLAGTGFSAKLAHDFPGD
jgi:hypothetical protein